MKVELKQHLWVDVIPHPEYGWVLTTQDAERLLGIGSRVISMNKSNHKNRYKYKYHYTKGSDILDYLLKYDNFEFILYPQANLWTRKGVIELSKWVRNVRKDFFQLVKELDRIVITIKYKQ
jgi:hypothetical protein